MTTTDCVDVRYPRPCRPLPWLGRRGDFATAVRGIALAAVVTAVYVVVAREWFATPTSNIEIGALLASLACVWLVRLENIFSMPLGIAACVLLGSFYLDIGLVGQGWLQWAFYIPVQVVGWWVWCRGGPQSTELRVSKMSALQWLAAVVLALAVWAATWAAFGALYDDAVFLGWDTSIVAASIVAQVLLTTKRTESWLWWLVPVNVSSIGLYVATGSWAFVFLYVVYLANAVWGLMVWRGAQHDNALRPATGVLAKTALR